MNYCIMLLRYLLHIKNANSYYYINHNGDEAKTGNGCIRVDQTNNLLI